jgi:Na+/H+-dicarboxylate symporter
MAFTIGAYGLGSLVNLGALIATFYVTSLLFVLLVLGTIAQLSGFSILRFIGYISCPQRFQPVRNRHTEGLRPPPLILCPIIL